MAQTAVLEFQQDPDAQPEHWLSKGWASAFISYRHNGKAVVERVRDGILRIVVDMTFGKLKNLVRSREAVNPCRVLRHARPAADYVSPRQLVESLERAEVNALKFQKPDGRIESLAEHGTRVKHWLCFPQLEHQVTPVRHSEQVL